jgi:NADH-quinone oxidoreductase subunit L
VVADLSAAPAGHSVEISLTVVSSIIAIAGLLAGWSWFRRRPLWQAPRLLQEKYRIDELYDSIFVQPVKNLSSGFLWRFVDIRIIDGAVNGAAYAAAQAGSALRLLQSGVARAYVAMVALGAVLIVWYFLLR